MSSRQRYPRRPYRVRSLLFGRCLFHHAYVAQSEYLHHLPSTYLHVVQPLPKCVVLHRRAPAKRECPCHLPRKPPLAYPEL